MKKVFVTLLILLTFVACNKHDSNQAFRRVTQWPVEFWDNQFAWFISYPPGSEGGWLVIEEPELLGMTTTVYAEFGQQLGFESNAFVQGNGSLWIEGVGEFELYEDEDDVVLFPVGNNLWGSDGFEFYISRSIGIEAQ